MINAIWYTPVYASQARELYAKQRIPNAARITAIPKKSSALLLTNRSSTNPLVIMPTKMITAMQIRNPLGMSSRNDSTGPTNYM